MEKEEFKELLEKASKLDDMRIYVQGGNVKIVMDKALTDKYEVDTTKYTLLTYSPSRDYGDTEYAKAKRIYDNLEELEWCWDLSPEVKEEMYEEWVEQLEENPYYNEFRISERRLEDIKERLGSNERQRVI